MSCDIIGGRTEQCKDAVSGLHAIYLIDYSALDFPGLAQYGTLEVVKMGQHSSLRRYQFNWSAKMLNLQKISS